MAAEDEERAREREGGRDANAVGVGVGARGVLKEPGQTVRPVEPSTGDCGGLALVGNRFQKVWQC